MTSSPPSAGEQQLRVWSNRPYTEETWPRARTKRKQPPRQTLLPGLGEIHSAETITFAAFAARVEALQRAGDSPGVLALVTAADASNITEVPSQLYLPLWLARLKVQALVPMSEPGPRRWVTGDVAPLVKPLLDQIAAMDDTFYASPEFDFFLQMNAHGPKAALAKYPWLLKACRAMPDNLDFLDRLRGSVFTLMDQDDWEEESQVDHDEVARLGDMTGALADLIDLALESVVLEEDRIRLTLYRLDLELRTADPWDYPSIVTRVRQLGSPPADEVGTLTPDSWAFAWELRYLRAEGFGEFVKAYAPEKLSRSARGLYHVLRSLSGSGLDAALIQGLCLLAEARERSDTETMGSEILVQTETALQPLPIGWVNLKVPYPADLLGHVLEVLPTENPYAPRLLTAALVWAACESYDKLSEEAERALSQEAIDWLTAHVPGFALQLAYVHPAGAVRLLLVLRELVQRGRTDSAERFDVEAEVDDAEPSREQRQEIRELLSQMSVYSGGMSEKLEREWRRVVGHALRALTRGADPSELVEALEVGRTLEGDLAAAREFGILAYLEHVAGDPTEAVRLYGEVLRNEAADPAWAVGNVKALANGMKTMDTAAVVLEAVEELDLPATRATETREMIAAARARLNKLTEHDQFERTAVARWPSLTAPARKLLAVWSALNSYKNMAELAQYANMDVDWVVRHHRKLVETAWSLMKTASSGSIPISNR